MIPVPAPAPVSLTQDDPIANMTADLLGLADTHRWTVIKTMRAQSVAEHSFNVAVIIMELCERLNIGFMDRANAIQWAIMHDLPETLTGDIDGKFKRDNPVVRSAVVLAESYTFPAYADAAAAVSPEVAALVKLADKVEAIMFIRKWGVGGRAEAVAMELERNLKTYTDVVSVAYQKSGMDDVMATVTGIVARDRYETHTVQTRPMPALAAAVDAVGAGITVDGGMSAL